MAVISKPPDQTIMPDALFEISSGGPVADISDPPLALWATKELAAAAYQRELSAFLASSEAADWRVVNEPIADKFHMTIRDDSGGHRMASQRWSVTATIGTITRPKAEQFAAGTQS